MALALALALALAVALVSALAFALQLALAFVLRTQGLGLRAQGPGLRVQGSGFRIQGSGLLAVGPRSLYTDFVCSGHRDTRARPRGWQAIPSQLGSWDLGTGVGAGGAGGHSLGRRGTR